MRRNSALAFLVVLAVLIGLVAFGRAPGLGAQTPTSAALANSPIIGTWLGHDVEDPSAPPFQVSFLADGIYLQFDELSAGDHAGVWRPTGPRTFQLTIQQVSKLGLFTIRGAGTVAADGRSFTVAYTVELVPAGGKSTGQYGQSHITGTRLEVEPMGTPVGPLSVLKGQLPKPTPGS